MSATTLYPWQRERWSALLRDRSRLPHALLLRGAKGVGKLDFARTLAQAMLCERPGAELSPCGVCSACRWMTLGHHPDFRTIEPAVEPVEASGEGEPSSARRKSATHISVDQVRDLADFIGLTTHRGGYRLVLIHPAESLNAAAANALLKMLEEPPARSLFLLVSHQPGRLLPTVLSRCRALDMPKPAHAAALAWLKEQGVAQAELALALAGGAPLAALVKSEPAYQQTRAWALQDLACAQDVNPIAAAERLRNASVSEVIELLQTWVYDLLALHAGGVNRYHLDRLREQQALAGAAAPLKLLDYQRELIDAKRLAQHPLNAKLVMEQLFFGYRRAFE